MLLLGLLSLAVDDKLLTELLSLAGGRVDDRHASLSTLLGNCIACFSILLFCPLVGLAPVVSSVRWTAEEILLIRLILIG